MKNGLTPIQKNVFMAAKSGYTVTREGRLLKPDGEPAAVYPDKNGYFRHSIGKACGGKGANRAIFIHRLVAFIKFGMAAFAKGMVTRHLNGDSRDNSYDNISIGTQSQNVMDMPRCSRRARVLKGWDGRGRSLTPRDVRSIRKKYSSGGCSVKKIGAQFGVSGSLIHRIVTRKIYIHDGYAGT